LRCVLASSWLISSSANNKLRKKAYYLILHRLKLIRHSESFDRQWIQNNLLHRSNTPVLLH
jgi:hypothetical protein